MLDSSAIFIVDFMRAGFDICFLMFLHNNVWIFIKKHGPELAEDEVTTVRKNLEALNVNVDHNLVRHSVHQLARIFACITHSLSLSLSLYIKIKRTWKHMHREQFIQRAILDAQECRKGFYHKDSIKTDVSSIL